MLTERTNEVIQKDVTFINISADRANVAFLSLGFRLWLDVIEVVRVRHRFLVVNHARLGHTANKHSVRSKVDVLLDVQRKHRVNVLRQNDQTIVRTKGCAIFKLVFISSAYKTKRFKDGERSFGCQAIDVHFARPFDDVVRIVLFVDGDRYAHGGIGKLIHLLCNNYSEFRVIHQSIDYYGKKIGLSELKDWITEYMVCDTYLYDDVMDYLEEKEEEEEVNEENSKYAPNKVRAKVLLEILEQCGLGLDQQDMTKVVRLVGFIIGASSNSLRNNLTTGNGLILSDKQHGKYVEEVNKLLTEMKSKIKLNCE